MCIRHTRQFRHIAANELPLRIKALRLRDGVKDAEVGLGIAARRGRPLPAAIISGQVIVIQVLGKKAFATAPVGSVAKSSPSRAGAYKSWTKAHHKKSRVSGLLFLCFILRPQGLDTPCALKTAYRLPDSAYLHIKIIAAQAVLTGENAKMMHK